MSKTCQVSGVQATSKAWCSQCPMVCLGSAGKRRSCRRCQDTHIHSLRCERRRRRSRNSRIALFMNDCLLPQLKGWLHRSCKDQCCQADGTPTFPGRSEEREWKRCKLYRQEMLVKCFFFFPVLNAYFVSRPVGVNQSPFVDLSTRSVYQAQPRLRRPHRGLRCLHLRRKPHEVGSY